MNRPLILLALAFLPVVPALIAYDCGGSHLNVTTISLTEVGECNFETRNVKTEDKYIQLLQLSEFKQADVIQCKVEITRTVHHCGMFSHIGLVPNGFSEYLEDISYKRCQQLHMDGSISFGNGIFLTGLKVNVTNTRSFTLAGSVNQDGKCTGTQFSDPYGSWEDVVVQAMARITLKAASVPVELDTNRIYLKSGTRCAMQDGFCIDQEDGHTFWKPMPVPTCKFDQYDVLYEGLATKITDISLHNKPEIYTLTTQEITFALTKVAEQPLCGYTLLRTEHPKLFILETEKGKTFAARDRIPVENLDIFTYMNSKFIYVETHIRTQMDTLYNNILTQKCELERQVLSNALSISPILPDEVAFSVMHGPGYMAVTAGEVIHIIKCIPVQVKIRHPKECYNELPVFHVDTPLFITPKSRILTRHGSQRECSNILPVMYKIDEHWHSFTPKPIETIPPQTLQPMTKPTWKYVSTKNLATSGIYTPTDLQNLQNHIMFPAEKAAILNTLARGATGQSIPAGSVSLYHLLDEETMGKFAESTAAKLWEDFMKFGSASAGIIAIYVIFQAVKLVIDTIVHGYTLHSIYGWSIHLLGAIWGSITHLLVYLSNDKRMNVETESGEESDSKSSVPTCIRFEELRDRMDKIEQISSRNLHS